MKKSFKKNKYFAKKTTRNGIAYDSKKESNRAYQLEMMEKAGEISDLKRQVRIKLLDSFKDSLGKTERGVTYIADFTYKENGKFIVEDVKSSYTAKNADYIIKRKLVKYFYPDYIFKEILK